MTRKLLVLLVLVSVGLEAQTVIRFKRKVQANIDTVAAGDFYVGEPIFTTDTYRLYVGTSSGAVRVGFDTTEIPDWDSVYARTTADGAANLRIAADGSIYRTLDTAGADEWRYLAVPELGAGTTGTGWVTTAYNINFYPFNVGQSFTPDSVVWYCLSSNATTDSFRVGIYSLAGALQCSTGLETHGSSASNIRLAQAFTSSPTLSPGTYILAWQHNTNSPPSMDIINTTAFFRVAQSKGWAGTIAASGGQSLPATLAGAAAYQAAANAPILILIGE